MTTRTQAIALYHERPTRTWQSIAEELGVSRECIRQHMQRAGLPNHHSPLHPELHAGRICPGCGGRKDDGARRCQRCRVQACYTQLTCTSCGQPFWRKNGQICSARKWNPGHGQHVFCNKSCYGAWINPTGREERLESYGRTTNGSSTTVAAE